MNPTDCLTIVRAPSRLVRPAVALAVAIATILAVPTRAAASDLRRGDPAPPVVGVDLDRRPVDTRTMRGRPLVLLFGETAHAHTRTAFAQVDAALDEADLSGQPVTWMLILSTHSRPGAVPEIGRSERHPPIIMHDVTRAIFRSFHVVVMPSVVVIDREGHVVHAISGPSERLGDIVHDAVLLGAGRISTERFERTLHPDAAPAPSADEISAQRSLRLADRLLREEMVALAEAKYREALEFDAACVEARLRLGGLLRQRGELAEAAELFASALALEPDSLDALCGLAHVRVLQGGEHADEAESLALEVVRREPGHARGHYVLGLVHQQRGEHEQAAVRFREAAERLLEQLGPDDGGPVPIGPSNEPTSRAKDDANPHR